MNMPFFPNEKTTCALSRGGAYSDQGENVETLFQLIQSQRAGQGVLPYFLGLTPLEYLITLQPLVPVNSIVNVDESSIAYQKGQLRQELLDMRRDEWLDVRDLLLEHRDGKSALEVPFAAIVAAGCLGGDHLWRDLGLPDRGALGRLLRENFGALTQKNVGDMKWKKFFYKQLCEQEGGYVCRSPSCEECVAYDDCFGPED